MDAETLAQLQQLLAQTTDGLRGEIRESARHTGILIEDLRHKLELVIEGQQFIRQDVSDVRSEISQESRETRALLQLSYQQMQQRVEQLERRVHAIEQHLGLAG